jgi:intergrase/recombinase
MVNGSLAELNSFSKAKKRTVLASLIALAKYIGGYEAFKEKMRNYGVRWEGRNAIESFLRILNDDSNNVLDWVKTCVSEFDASYATLVKFILITGLRKGEAINAFNLAIRLSRAGRLDEVYNAELETLELYKFPKVFLRRSKNAFFSFVPAVFINELVQSRTISETGLKRRLERRHMQSRLKALRHYHATFMVRNGLLREEADLLQGRINQSIFMRHYFSPSINELRQRAIAVVQRLLSLV